MKANELRIGNYINWEVKGVNRHTKIEIGHLYSVDQSVGKNSDSYTGIPLTEEILLKCGFTKTSTSMYLSLPKDENEELPFFLWLNGYLNLVDINDNVIVEIFSLHQLQNLYFALTGEELEINL